jgi:tetratricopeptide (TPR) repeat protein
MDKGNDFALKNQYSSAIEEWKAVLKYDPNNKPAQDFIAGAQAKQGTEVEKYYQEGQSYVQKGNSVQALNVWNKALEMDPENQKVKAAIAKIILKKGQKLKALLGQGDELYAEQDYPGALQKYQLALQNTPGNKEAKAKIKKLQKLQGSKFEDYLAKGKKYLITGQNKKAIDNLEMARSINSNDPNVNTLYNRAKLAWRKNIESLLTAGEDLFDKGSKEEAKNKFQSVLKEDPNNEKANDYIKRMTGQNEQKADAEKIKNLYYEGVNLYINGKIKEAIDKWNEVLKLDHNNTNAANNKKKATLKLQAIGQLSQ